MLKEVRTHELAPVVGHTRPGTWKIPIGAPTSDPHPNVLTYLAAIDAFNATT